MDPFQRETSLPSIMIKLKSKSQPLYKTPCSRYLKNLNYTLQLNLKKCISTVNIYTIKTSELPGTIS